MKLLDAQTVLGFSLGAALKYETRLRDNINRLHAAIASGYGDASLPDKLREHTTHHAALKERIKALRKDDAAKRRQDAARERRAKHAKLLEDYRAFMATNTPEATIPKCLRVAHPKTQERAPDGQYWEEYMEPQYRLKAIDPEFVEDHRRVAEIRWLGKRDYEYDRKNRVKWYVETSSGFCDSCYAGDIDTTLRELRKRHGIV